MEVTREAILSADDSGRAASCVLLAERWLVDHPDDLGVIHRYASMLYHMTRYDEATRVLIEAIDRFPEARSVFYNDMGRLHRYRGDFALAEAWHRKSIEADPTEASGYIYLGAVQARQGKLELAEATHRRGIECKGGCIDEAHLNLGLVLRGQGRLAEAAECFRKAIEIDPEYQDAIVALADVEGALALSARPSHQSRGLTP